MMITVNDTPSKAEWEQGILAFTEANFLQSYNWGVFHERLGKKVIRCVCTDGSKVIGMASGVVEDARRGRYLAVAGGPLIDWHNKNSVEAVFRELRKKALEENCVFIRFRPQVTATRVSAKVLRKLSALEAPMHLTADLTLQLDLTLSDETLLSDMRKNTRSAIRKAERVGITTQLVEDVESIRQFYDEEKKVAERQGFVPFSYDFLRNQFEVFLADKQVCLVRSFSKEGALLASAFVIFYNNEAVYHYGISTDANQKLPGSYACQWRAIAEAKRRKCTRYNFWGVAPKEATKHRFAGVSLFKRGFGGFEVPYLEAHDIPLSWRYWVTFLFEFFRKKYRHL